VTPQKYNKKIWTHQKYNGPTEKTIQIIGSTKNKNYYREHNRFTNYFLKTHQIYSFLIANLLVLISTKTAVGLRLKEADFFLMNAPYWQKGPSTQLVL
jgi:hypothetical protein